MKIDAENTVEAGVRLGEPGSQRMTKVIKLCVCTVFVIIGVLMCLQNGREAYLFSHDGGTVDAKVMKLAPGEKGKGVRPLLQYKVNDTTYLRFGDDTFGTKQYSEGQTVSIRYLKEDPNTITMLDPNRNWPSIALFAGMAVVGFIAAVFVALPKPERKTL